MILTAYSPLARGRISSERELVAIGKRHGKTASQITLRWLVQQHGVAAIPKTSGKAHLAENFAIFDFALSAEEMTAIGRLGGNSRLVDPSWAPEWDPPI
jgi:2,5-diketo-D-gluconate reductase B